MEMTKYKLGDAADILVGFPFESEKFNTEGNGIRLVRGMNVSERFLRFGNDSRWWSDLTDGLTPYYLKEYDIVIGMDGSKVGKNFAIVKKEDLPLILVQRVACVRAKKGYDQKYIWQYISSPRFIEYVNTIKTGSSIPHISGKQIADFPIFLPTLSEQKKIAAVLSALDDYIENLRAQNRVLEQTAKTIYDYTFLQCAGHQTTYNKTLNRNIPADWEVKSVNQMAKSYRGVAYDKSDVQKENNGGILVLRGNNIQDNNLVYDGNVVYIPENLVEDNQHIKKGDIIMTMSSGSKEHIGKCTMFQYDSKHTYGAFLTKFTPNRECRYYFYMNLISDYFKAKIKSVCNGTGINNLTNQTFNEIFFPYPDSKTLDVFEKTVTPIFDKMGVNTKQIETLTTQRNTLLPLLMTGQVGVK